MKQKLTTLSAALLLLSLLSIAQKKVQQPKPNVLLIITDQMSANMMSCTGNPYVKTPNLDALAASGIRFTNAYAANPVCVPSRYSMFSGELASQIGLEHNGQQKKIDVPQDRLDKSMGFLFRNAGYNTVYGGKTHLMGQNGVVDKVEMWGFDLLTADFYDGLPKKCESFFQQKHDQPFLLVASFMNPHDICYMALNEYEISQGRTEKGGRFLKEALKMPDGMSREDFVSQYCPPLPPNFEIPKNELTAFMADKPAFMHYARNNWNETDWRLHRWAYARLTEMVDAQIGRVLNALKKSGLDENTIVVFVSDHGDQDGAHRLEHKAFLYEESSKVPFLISWKNNIEPGQVDTKHLVSGGIDLLPTLCDLANIPVPQSFVGKSVRKLAMQGDRSPGWRDHLVVENNIGRLLIWDSWKYIVGKDVADGKFEADETVKSSPSNGQIREMLINLDKDPGEMNNLAADKKYKAQLQRGRRLLTEWYRTANIDLDAGYKITK